MHGHLLHHLLQHSSVIYPKNTAVVFKEKSLTYADLDTQSDRLALTLQCQGIRKGDRVGILLAKSVEQIVSLFGILKSGAIYVPLDPAAPVSRINYMIRHCGIDLLVTTSKNIQALLLHSEDNIPFSKAVVIGNDGPCLPDKFLALKYLSMNLETDCEPAVFQPLDMADNSPAYILHTSGSTGNPKGVAISHLNALTFIEMAADLFKVTTADRFCNHAPLHFDLSVFDIFVAIKCGATIVMLPEVLSTFPVKLAEYIDEEQITIWNSVASVLTMLADKGMLGQRNFDCLRLVHFSGDIMPVKYLRQLRNHMVNASFYNIYGQTEANSSLGYLIEEIPANDSWRIPVGKALPNFEVFAIGEDQQVVSQAGKVGELYVCSSTVALGYWNDQDKTLEKFVPDPRNPFLQRTVYRTGDLVRLDQSGNYMFCGRKDHMIKSRGYRIELEEIETVLAGHPEIATAVVTPIPDEIVGNRISAIIVRAAGCSLREEELVWYCAQRLPKYMIPELIDFRDFMPLTSSGKVDRKKLSTGSVITG